MSSREKRLGRSLVLHSCFVHVTMQFGVEMLEIKLFAHIVGRCLAGQQQFTYNILVTNEFVAGCIEIQPDIVPLPTNLLWVA